ncbi:hypothetical protein [Bdellovibrio sp. HCB274]|uniref:hypothetical protein n=1 Tax=Bdellovibrio sp. HCB274 TaxID=3394361 RepID=UPI0039B47A28
MKMIFCALLVMLLPLVSFADSTAEIAQVDSFIRQEVEMLAVKSAYSANHPDILKHQRNIQKASEHKALLARQNSRPSCRSIFN